MGNNASLTKKGFNYQDVVALIYMLRNIGELDSVNIEGKEDVDLHYSDGRVDYLQAKMAKNVVSKSRTEALKDCLRVLIQDYLDDKEAESSLIYVTNAHYPFIEQKDYDFQSSKYMRYNYASLNQVQKNSISRQINRLKKEKDKKGNVKYPEISNMASESVTKFLNKFSVVKLKYEGDDDQSKLELLDKQIDDFMADANITTNFFKTLRNGWYYMVVRSSEEQNKKITKRDFVAHTFTAMTFAQLNINDFYDKCDIDFPSRSYIDSETGKIEDIFLTNFEVRPAIIDLFSIYRAENPEKKRTQSLVGFVTEKTTEIADVFKISADNEIDKDLSKYLAWIIVTQNNRFEGIKEVSNYED